MPDAKLNMHTRIHKHTNMHATIHTFSLGIVIGVMAFERCSYTQPHGSIILPRPFRMVTHIQSFPKNLFECPQPL